jgi:hypothetical protein
MHALYFHYNAVPDKNPDPGHPQGMDAGKQIFPVGVVGLIGPFPIW